MSDNPIVILSVLALLPLVPAILLFKLLPGGTTEVEGPLAGLKVKLGGAFGGYVALTVFLATFYWQALKPDANAIETWTVIGDVQRPMWSEINCKLSPPLNIDPGNHFEWQIPVPKGAKLPHVTFEAAGYEGETLYLSDGQHINKRFPLDIDAKKHVVTVKAPIALQKKDGGSAMAAGGL
jgi:hypothetical protein